jgi:membrane protein YdbS with pleckstrin-like domain
LNNLDLSSTEIVIALASALVLVCYVVLIALPAARCYGRVWEKLAAGALTLYVLATLLGIGAAIGFAIVWTYDTYAG